MGTQAGIQSITEIAAAAVAAEDAMARLQVNPEDTEETESFTVSDIRYSVTVRRCENHAAKKPAKKARAE